MTQFDYKNHKNLVLKAQEGDSEAFSQLYKLTYKRQYVIIRRFFYNDFIVEDLLQDIYVKLFQTIHSIKNPEYFMAYLNKITYNTCISYKRKSSFKNESTIEDLFFDSIPENNISMMPEDNTLSAECSHSLSEGLKLLSAEERLVFLMRYYDDMRIKHIVEATALSESTVKRRINSAKKILRQYLTAQGIHGFLWAPLAHNMMADAFNATIFDTALEDGVLPNILRATKDTPKPQKIKKETMHLFPKLLLIVVSLILPAAVFLAPAAYNTFWLASKEDQQPPALVHYDVTDSEVIITLSDDKEGLDLSSVYALTQNGTRILPNTQDNNTVTFNLPTESMTIYATDLAGNTSSSRLDIVFE